MNHAVNWEAISAIGQIVGAIALVISLIYVASEVRRNTRATHLESAVNVILATTAYIPRTRTRDDCHKGNPSHFSFPC